MHYLSSAAGSLFSAAGGLYGCVPEGTDAVPKAVKISRRLELKSIIQRVYPFLLFFLLTMDETELFIYFHSNFCKLFVVEVIKCFLILVQRTIRKNYSFGIRMID